MSTHALNKLNLFFREHKLLQYKKRALILHANDTPSSVFYIKSGFVRVYRLSEQGEELTLTILQPGDFFPLTYGITDVTNPYYLETMTPLSLWKAPLEQFVQFIKQEPDVYFDLTTRVLVRFDGVLNRMEHLVFSNAYTKVAATILSCAKRFGKEEDNAITIEVPLTHKDIATLIGITRETTSLEMKKLEKQGYVSRNGRFLVVQNLPQLEEEIGKNTDSTSFVDSL